MAPTSKNSRKRNENEIRLLVCLSCKSTGTGRRREKCFEGTLNSGVLRCRGLTQHIQRCNNENECWEFYNNRQLIDHTNGGRIDFRTSGLEPIEEDLPSPKRHHFSVSRLGLTLTGNGPLSSLVQDNHNLNSQVLYNPCQPRLDRDVIQSLARTNENVLIGDGQEFTHNDSDFSEAALPAVPTTIDKIEALLPPSNMLIAEIELLNVMIRHKMPLNAYKSIFEWAKMCQGMTGFEFSSRTTKRRERQTIVNEIHNHIAIPDYAFEPKTIKWLPDEKPIQVYVRPFMKAVNALLSNPALVKEENFSFPHPENPFLSKPTETGEKTYITELHHGKWWSETWEKKCTAENEILVPVILYMDSISLDVHGKLSLTPLNMTLGIFNTATRKLPSAWETLYFHPDTSFEATRNETPARKKSQTSLDVVHNLHNGLRVALESFKELTERPGGVFWDNLPYAGKHWEVSMKFAIAFVIGDTELHDKLCGRFNCRNDRVKCLCRHCNCPTKYTVNPSKQPGMKLFVPSDLSPHLPLNTLRDVSHHPIENAFHDLDFGANQHNIHLATPGECLHMHQLGVAKRAMEAFEDFVMGRVRQEPEQRKKKGHRQKALDIISQIAQQYGQQIARQSDREFPRTKFTTSILSTTKKEGKDFAGIILCALIAMMSDTGKDALKSMAHLSDERIRGQIRTFELILQMEEFLQYGALEKGPQQTNFRKTIVHFINEINKNCKRKKGMDTVLIKNHLYFHLHDYIEMWGPPAGWDSAPSESHHKSEIKAPSKNTQQNPSTLIKQTIKRMVEYRTIKRFRDVFPLQGPPKSSSRKPPVWGARFSIFKDPSGKATMEWKNKQRNGIRPFYPQEVLDFCAEYVVPITKDNRVEGFTEHYRTDKGRDDLQLTFRCHPSFRSEAGQTCDTWYDWAVFDLGEDGQIPCRILCLLDLFGLTYGTHSIRGFDVDADGPHAIVQRFRSEPTAVEPSRIISRGKLRDELYLLPCDCIVSEVAVVQNRSGDGTESREFFVLANKVSWRQQFFDTMRTIGRKSFHELYLPSMDEEDLLVVLDEVEEDSDLEEDSNEEDLEEEEEEY